MHTSCGGPVHPVGTYFLFIIGEEYIIPYISAIILWFEKKYIITRATKMIMRT